MKKMILVAVSSSVAAFKSVQLVSDLLKKGFDVEVMMTKNATQFITPLSFSSLTHHKTYVDTFDREVDYSVEHIALAKRADVVIIVPASANVIAKVANGICDDMLTTTFLAATCPKIIAPAMNTNMYLNPITQHNLEKCKQYGMHIIEPQSGLLACLDEGIGKLADLQVIQESIMMHVYPPVLKGKTVLISAGPTIEKMDPVRYVSNYSSGKMGYAIARAARNMGAKVILVSGKVNLDPVPYVQMVYVESAKQMDEAMKVHFEVADYVVMSAAVADYTFANVAQSKLKKSDEMNFELVKTNDILAYLGTHKTHQKLCGFAMETDDILNHAKDKLRRKNCDMLVVNDLHEDGAGFQVDTNRVTIVYPNHHEDLELMSKEKLAYEIIKRLVEV